MRNKILRTDSHDKPEPSSSSPVASCRNLGSLPIDDLIFLISIEIVTNSKTDVGPGGELNQSGRSSSFS